MGLVHRDRVLRLEHNAHRGERSRCHSRPLEDRNHIHYSRDVTFGEDKSRIRTNPGVFARLRSFAFNILKSDKTSTLCQDRYRAALAGIDNLLEVLAIPQR
jgi:hypothetical protein